MTTLTREQEIIKQAVLQEVVSLLTDINSEGLYLLKSAQVIRMLNISTRTLYRMRTSGVLRAKKEAYCYRYAYQDVFNLLKNNPAQQTAHTKIK